jgi:hypothetical protein
VIRSVSFTNFQGLTTPRPLPLSKFTVLIGLNGSGKTAVLRALWFVLSHARHADKCLSREDVPPDPKWSVETMGIGDSAAAYVYPNGAVLFSRCTSSRIPPPVMVDDESVDYVVRGWRNSGRMWPGLEDLVKEGAVLPPVVTPEAAAAADRGIDDRPWHLSRGVLQAIAAKQLFSEHPDARVLLWDDLGSSMHPALVQHVVRWLVGLSRVQVVASTHSIDVLHELAMSNHEYTVLRLRRDGEKVTAENLLAGDVDRYFEDGIDPRKVLGGKEGGA